MTTLPYVIKNAVGMVILSGAALAASLFGAENGAPADSTQCHSDSKTPAKLIKIVREATQQFIDVNEARAAGYEKSMPRTHKHLSTSLGKAVCGWSA